MHSTKVLFSSLHFLVVTIFFCVGFFLYFTPYFPHWEIFLRNIIEDASSLRLAGGIFFAVGLLLCYSFYKLYQGRFYQVTMKNSDKNAFIDLSVVRRYAEAYLHKEFLGKVSLQDVICRDKKKLELVAKFAPLPFSEHEEILHRIENEFAQDLANYLGYKQEFLFTVIVSE
jgi:hypothetical protein